MRNHLAPAALAAAVAVSSPWLGCGTSGDPAACVPATESCDGVDDDCDGEIDEAGATGCTTYFEDVDADGYGGASACLCAPAAPYTEASGGDCDDADRAVHPGAAEVCNGVDDDCDAQIDQAIAGCCAPAAVQRCGVEQGICRAGTSTCGGDFAWGPCLDAEGAPVTLPGAVAETCDGTDEDCDGQVDEGYDVGLDCSVGTGACAAAGVTVCTADGTGVECGASPGSPGVEACNGVDDDCDGRVDVDGDGVALSMRCYEGPPDTEGVAACHAGVATCSQGGWSACEGQALPATEVCNLLDDDCDGVDDDLELAGAPCTGGGTSNTGSCVASWACAGAGPGPGPNGLTCTQVVGPRAEECNGLDDDCDASVDEDAAGQPLSRACYAGPSGTLGVGVCVGGSQTCGYAAWGACEGEVLPSSEVCNGRDDDCNGSADASVTDPWAGQACCSTGYLEDCTSTGAGSRCHPGSFVCSGGAQACSGAVVKSAETCNGIDDDCDGVADDVPAIGGACSGGGTNTTGACRTAWACDPWPGPGPYGLTCKQTVGPAPELCNGLDDDCDATVDESPTDVGGSCCAWSSCSVQGAWACVGGVKACVGSAPAGGSCTLGQSCCPTGDPADCQNTGAGTRCQLGTCADGPVCVGGVAKMGETCNGGDDDCDGVVDDVAGIGTACTGSGLRTLGACRAGYACAGGASGPGPNGLTCTQIVGPVAETCNGIDDDCDGTADNAPTDVGGACCAYSSCSTQGVWVCSSGTRQCVGSAR